MSDPKDYTVGWICAISTEYVAAQEFLDEEHDGPAHVAPNDTNDYTLGIIKGHRVVIAVLPDGEYGTAPAASVAGNMLNSFPNIRIGLMVGIGGGAPSKRHDIRLGDVVVSSPANGRSGVVQYDFGKTIQGREFQDTRFLSPPPALLRKAVSGLKTQHERKGNQLEKAIDEVLSKNRRLWRKYKRPEAYTDRLYQSSVVHPEGDYLSCATACGDDPSKITYRPERTEDDDSLTLHYGLIASANQLMKDALIRDKLAQQLKVLCFEMEAAGLMNEFPCLVIRGICDYSDSHKNEDWQGFAAMSAAAYAKDLLSRIRPQMVEAEKTVLSGLQMVAEQHRDIAQKQLNLQELESKQKQSKEEEECLRLFRLTSGDRDTTYEWYKDRVEDRVNGTCAWFLSHKNFQKWLEQESGPLMVSADPGCGKSVLAKFLIDKILPRSATICYFFFKERDQNTVRQAICALLHQVFTKKPSLIHHAMDVFKSNGRGLINSTSSLWKILREAAQDPLAGPITIVLDALDECAESEFENLIRNIENLFWSNRLRKNGFKVLLTSRPYEDIVSEFQQLLRTFPYIRIPGEDESESISKEVDQVIRYRVNQLTSLSDTVRDHLMRTLLNVQHRTYLWVYLIFNYLKTASFKKTTKGVDSAMETMPKTVNEAYEQILQKSKDDTLVRNALAIILAASQPLSVSEMNVAVNIDENLQSIESIDMEEEKDFELRLRSGCGLFISVTRGKVYLLHQTAREFLISKSSIPTTIQQGQNWHHSITMLHAHTVLAEICVRYLDLLDSDPEIVAARKDYTAKRHALIYYAASNWGDHFREARIDRQATIATVLRICDASSKVYWEWCRIHSPYSLQSFAATPRTSTSLLIASRFGLESVVKQLATEDDSDPNVHDQWNQTPLLWAVRHFDETVVQMLLETEGIDPDVMEIDGHTPLSLASKRGNEEVVKLLLATKQVNPNGSKGLKQTPLCCASERGHNAIVKLLLAVKSVDANLTDENGRTPLSVASGNGHLSVVDLLLSVEGLDPNIKDHWNRTPLVDAVDNGHEAIVKLLLKDNRVDPDPTTGVWSRTPLSYASERGYEAIVELLLQNDRVEPDASTKRVDHRTPLSYTAERGHEGIVKLLLQTNRVNPDARAKEICSRTPLSYASENGHKGIVELLLKSGRVDPDAKMKVNCRTPLSYASEQGHEEIVRLLLESDCVDPDTRTKDNRRTSLSYASERGHEKIVNLLLATKRVDLDSKDARNRTPLWWATDNGRKTVVKILLAVDNIDPDVQDDRGHTPLVIAAERGHKEIVRLLLATNRVDPDVKDKWGRTPLIKAAEGGYGAVVRLLLATNCVDPNTKDQDSKTALHYAAARGCSEIVTSLLATDGIDPDFRSQRDGSTPLLLSVKYRREDIVQMLLATGRVDVDSANFSGWTPLFGAVVFRHWRIVEMLLATGRVRIGSRDEPLAPLAYAVKSRDDAMIALLEAHVAEQI